jgi:hypothetical protein
MGNSNPLNSAFSRVWLIDGRARPDHAPEFLNFLKVTSVDQNFGAVNPIFNPSKSEYGKFDQVGEFRDEEERVSTELVGHYARDIKSRLLTLAQKGCKFDTQLHIGECEDPSRFNSFQKVVIFEGVIIETYGTEDLGALEPGEQGKVDETGAISAQNWYEFVPLGFSNRTPSGVTNELIDIAKCDSPSCGNCEDESDGCEKFYAISKAAGGSPSTPADVVFTLDKGLTWYFADVDTLGVAVDPTAIECVGEYVVVISNTDGDQMHIALTSEFDGTTDPAFILVTTGFVAGGGPNDIYSLGNTAYLCGNFGYIYKTTDVAAGVTVLDAGVATISDMNAIHMLSEEFGISGGNDGALLTIRNDLVSAIATSPVGIGTDITAVYVKTELEWFVGTSAGTLFRTLDGGTTWTQIVLPGTAPTIITAIDFSSDSVMYVSGTVSGKGEIFISISGGNSFIRAPRLSSSAMPNNDQINAIAVCEDDVDFVVGVGLAADGTDGFIVIGSD